MSKIRTAVVTGLIGVALAGGVQPAWSQGPVQSMSEERKDFRAKDHGLVREVRLALVCYGGSSLAIYIHGNTKELFRLVQASKALQQDAEDESIQQAVAAGEKRPLGTAGKDLTGSAQSWYGLLLDKWQHDPQGIRTRVVVDIVAGTSAGGINGVILAKALAHDLPVDDLTELWLTKASLAKLTNHYFGLLRVLVGKPPVDGNALVGWLFEALNNMDHKALGRSKSHNPSLLPGGDRLDLLVTTTDRFGYPQNLVVGDPASAVEKRYRHVMHFIYPGVNRGCDPNTPRLRGEVDHFCPEWTPMLAFAARASSSIPGVFPPLNLGDTMQTIAKNAASGPPPGSTVTPKPVAALVHNFFRNYELQQQDEKGVFATSTYFVDGGVLDNHPFGPAIEAILSRPQEQEVQRYLVYLQPDPGTPPVGLTEKPDNPGLLKTVWAGLSGIPSGQPILDNLNEVMDHNNALDRIRDIVQAEEQAARSWNAKSADNCDHLERLPVAQRFACGMGYRPSQIRDALLNANQSELQDVRRKVEAAADSGLIEKEGEKGGEKGGAAEPAGEEAVSSTGRSYISLRVYSVLAQFVDVLASRGGCDYPEESAQRALIGLIIKGWAASPEQNLIGPEARLAEQKRFLEDFDVGYQRRQLRFVIDWINDQYTKKPPPSQEKRELLDKMKHAGAAQIEELTSLVEGTSLDPGLHAEVEQLGAVFCRLRPWQEQDGQTVTLSRQATAFLADSGNLAALSAFREKIGLALNRLQQKVRDQSFQEFKALAENQLLTPEEKGVILVRYLAFPFWDRQIYPYIAFSQVAEFREIDIYRLSPNDATLLGRRTAKDKLVGAKLAHFGAFLSRPGRESDYLWGRLDSGERLMALLGLGTGGAKDLFTTIVQEEAGAGLVRASIRADRQAEIDRLP